MCTCCIMDTTDPDITFDEDGSCNHDKRYKERTQILQVNEKDKEKNLENLVNKIKAAGKGKPYDCIIGVSGGVDSTYIAYLTKKLGLRPLAIHLDNGWDSELAVSNIEKTLKKLDIELYTYVLDWEEFRELQLAFLNASTPDSEIPTDHAIIGILYRFAAKNGIKYIINGTNLATESILPIKWGYGYYDTTYIKAVNKQFGSRKTFSNYPLFPFWKLLYHTFISGIKDVALLNYVEFHKPSAMKLIQDELGWQYYGGKHYESIYTRFFQAYILPKKFNIDKRLAHLSSLIHSSQITRGEALEEIKKETYPADKLQEDKEYVIKKLRMTEASFEAMMQLPTKNFLDYPTEYSKVEFLKKIATFFKKSSHSVIQRN